MLEVNYTVKIHLCLISSCAIGSGIHASSRRECASGGVWLRCCPFSKKKVVVALVVLMMFFGGGGAAFGADYMWDSEVGDGDWTNSDNYKNVGNVENGYEYHIVKDATEIAKNITAKNYPFNSVCFNNIRGEKTS